MSKALDLHKNNKGKVGTHLKVEINSLEDLSLAYTPGVAEPCLEISKDESLAYEYTSKGNTVAIITDGTAVLGLGDIGPLASIPVMEGKAALFKRFADIDAVAICIDEKDDDKLVEMISKMTATFGGINLEDIAAPRCFEIERKLQEKVNIPVFHDDQHGTAIVVSAAIINALKLANKNISDVKIVISGAGAAGTAIAKLLKSMNANNIIMVDREGAISSKNISSNKKDLLTYTNPNDESGSLKEVIVDADIFIGVSAPKLLNRDDISKMKENAIVFALANPVPEILYEEAKAGNALIVGTGRSDFPNQINNILAFPGVFKGALAARATYISEEMKVAAVEALASYIKDEDLREDYVIASIFDEGITDLVAESVKNAWRNKK